VVRLRKPRKALPYKRIKTLLESVDSPYYKALFCAMYGSGARIGEVVGSEKHDKFTGITINDVQVRKIEVGEGKNKRQEKFLLLTLETQKNRSSPVRTIPISFSKEKWLCTPILNRVKEVKEKGGNKLFPISTRYARLKAQELFKVDTHTLRHSRATHLITEFNYPIERLQRVLGHSSLKPTGVYLHLFWKDDAERLVR